MPPPPRPFPRAADTANGGADPFAPVRPMPTPRPATVVPRPARRPIGGRRGIILLFVVVLLTLLAIVGSAFLISTRLDAGQVGAEARGDARARYTPDAADRVTEVRRAAERAAMATLFLDLFETSRVGTDRLDYNLTATEPTTYTTFATAQREWPDGEHVYAGGATRTDVLLQPFWRPARGSADAVFGVGTYPMLNGTEVWGDAAYRAGFGAATPANGWTDLHFPYYPVDALGPTDPHLAARLPVVLEAGTPADYSDDQVFWDWVSGPLVGVPGLPVDNVFVDPRVNSGGTIGVIAVNPTDTAEVMNFDLGANHLRRARLSPWTSDVIEYPTTSEVQSFLPPTADPSEFYNDRARVLPTLFLDDKTVNGRPDGNELQFVAADADGDGVADAGLVPIVFDATAAVGTPARYTDPQTGRAFTLAARIVDNNAAVNANTALARTGDANLPPHAPGAPTPAASVVTAGTAGANFDALFALPNYGVWPANIGLYDLFPLRAGDDAAADPVTGRGFAYAAAPPALGSRDGGATLATTGFRDYLTELFGGGDQAVAVTYEQTGLSQRDPLTPADQLDAVADTLGEAAGLTLARRTAAPEPLGLKFDGTNFLGAVEPRPFDDPASTRSLLYGGGGMLVPDADLSRLDRSAFDLLALAAGNYAPRPDLIFGQWPLFDPDYDPADPDNQQRRRSLWARLFKTADPDQTRLLFDADPILDPSAADVVLPISPRAGLVAQNGVSQAFSPKMLNPAAAVGGSVAAVELSRATLPTGMPPYAVVPVTPPAVPDYAAVRPPVRAGLNTAGFGELWRAYWNAMADRGGFTDPDGGTGGGAHTVSTTQFIAPNPPGVPAQPAMIPAGTDDPFDGTKVGGAATLTREQTLLLRAALAAVNTMDIRDSERADVDLVPPAPAPRIPGLPRPGDADVTVAEIDLGTFGSGATTTLKARVYGTEAQPFISEFIIDYDTGGAPVYLAVELVNPYPFPLYLRGWQLVALNPDATPAPMSLATLGTAATPLVMPPAHFFTNAGPDGTAGTADDFPDVEMGRLVLTGGTPISPTPPPVAPDDLADGEPSVDHDGDDNTPPEPIDSVIETGDMVPFDPDNDPDTTTAGLATVPVTVPALTSLGSITGTGTGTAVVLVRPAVNPATDTPPGVVRALPQMVPLDLVDTRGMDPTTLAGLPARFRYARDDHGTATADNSEPDEDLRSWKYVFHGKWDNTRLPGGTNETLNKPVSVGLVRLNPLGTTPDSGSNGELGLPNSFPTIGDGTPDALSETDGTTVYPTFVAGEDDAGVTATGGFPVGPVLGGRLLGGPADVGRPVDPTDYNGKNFRPVHPYGGFARDGDAFQIPILGGYTIYNDIGSDGFTDTDVVSIRPVTLDTEHSDADSNELWGRFIPFEGAIDADGDGTLNEEVYAWAADLLDYVTANDNYGDDTFPNVDLRQALFVEYDFDNNGTTDAVVGDRSVNAADPTPDNAAAFLPRAFFRSYSVANSGDADIFPAGTRPTYDQTSVFDGNTVGLLPVDNDGDGDPGLSDPVAELGIFGGSTALAAQARYAEAFTPAQGKLNVLTAEEGILKTAPLAVDLDGQVDTDAAGSIGQVAATASGLVGFGGGISVRDPRPAPNPNFSNRGAIAFDGGTAGEAVETLADLDRFGFAFPNAGSAADRYVSDVTGRLPTSALPPAPGSLTSGAFYDVDPALAATASEEATTNLARVSNLLTTRSDHYTVYLLVQAWDGFGTDQARVVRQERVAFTVDRSGVTPPANGLDLPGDTPDVGTTPTIGRAYLTLDDAIQALKVAPITAD